jgi:hypothetical protein
MNQEVPAAAQRIFVDVGVCPGCDTTAWAALTVTEAGQLGRALLSEVAAAKQQSSGRGTAGRSPGPDVETSPFPVP